MGSGDMLLDWTQLEMTDRDTIRTRHFRPSHSHGRPEPSPAKNPTRASKPSPTPPANSSASATPGSIRPDIDPRELPKRTLTNLYNLRPEWLSNAHRTLDEAVFAAYGWPSNLTKEEILARLLALNHERAAAQEI
jgi:hypothetical protein